MAFLSRAFGASAFSLLLAIAASGQQQPAATPPAAAAPEPAAAQLAQTPFRASGDPDAPTLPALTGINTSAWLYKGSDIAPDQGWKFGTLPNGLRFAVRRNGVPPGQVAVRVRIDAGSLHEEDGERGFAHFIEHLSFRGSQYVPDGEAKRVWQRFGATFGSDSNASTTPTQTVYKLDLPGATAASVDESLKILSGMMAAPALTDASVAAERPVVLAEQREQPGPQVKLGDAVRAAFFAGQPLADRSPIGTIRTLEGATGPSVKAFHDRWYRPARAAVIISGDMDPLQLAQLVVKNFSGWRGTGPDPADPDFGRPDPKAPATAALVEPGAPPLVATAVLRPWRFNADTVIFNQRRLVDFLAIRLINRRLETRARAGGSFIQASVDLDDISRSANATTTNILPVGDDWEAALKDVRAVIADAQATPPTQGEVDREYADFETAMRTQVETSRVEAGARQAEDMVQALDIRETTTSPQTSYAILRDAHANGMFSPEALLASTRRLFQGDTRALVNTRAADPGAVTRLAAALSADVSGLATRRVAQANVTFADLPALGRPGTVTERTRLDVLDMDQVVFANGVRLLVYPNASESGRVYVKVRFGGGYNALPGTRPTPAWAGDLALFPGGIGRLDQGDLDQLTSGRRIGAEFDTEDDAFTLSALTSPADYADQLRLFAAKIARPRWDPAPVARARAVALAAYDGYDSSPDGVISRDLEGLLRDGDPRWGTPSRATVQATDAAAFRKLWQPLLASGPIEVMVFGDVRTDAAIPAVAASFGALPARKPDARTPAPVRFPAHVAAPVTRYHTGTPNQAAAVIAWPTGGGIEGIRDSRMLDVLAQVFADRLFEKLRQAAGASYSPNVASQWPVGLAGGGRLIAIGQVSPDKVPFFFETARAIAADLVATPVAPDELQRIMRPMGQFIIRASTGNQFWMNQLGGATADPRRAEATKRIVEDFVAINPAGLQATAAKYLRPETDWTFQVLPKQ